VEPGCRPALRSTRFCSLPRPSLANRRILPAPFRRLAHVQ
jgi:hypothetical protein